MNVTRNRGGFTLVELIVVSVLGALVLGAVLQVLITNQRTYTVQSATIQGQQGSRMAIEVLFNELREASPGDGDLLAMGSTFIRVRLMRKLGIACEVELDGSPPRIRVLDNSGDDFADDDSVFVFAENREATGNDDVWLPSQVLDVDDTVTCVGGQPALDLEVDTTGFGADSVRVGAPIRAFQEFFYQRGDWNGLFYVLRDGIPLAGPIRESDGLQFVYRDALGAITSTPEDVRQIEVRIRTGAEVMNAAGDLVVDSLDTWIYTRN